MPTLAVCSRDLHWHWINWTLLCGTMEVSMLRLAWLPIAQHVFQPALTGRLELISRKIVSSEQEQRLSWWADFANWMQGVTAIWRKISRSWAPRLQNLRNRWAKKWGPTCNRDISNSAIYTTAIYRAYTVQWNLFKTITRFYGLSIQVVFQHRENKHDSVKTVPDKLQNLCVFSKTSLVSLYRFHCISNWWLLYLL